VEDWRKVVDVESLKWRNVEIPSEMLGQFTRKESRRRYLRDYPRERESLSKCLG